MAGDIKYLFTHLWVNFISSCEKCLFESSDHLKLELFTFLLLKSKTTKIEY